MKRSSQRVRRKTFQGIANGQAALSGVFARIGTAVNTPQKARVRAWPRSRSSDNEQAGMAICTSSFIRTMTVGSGFAPDLLTPRARGLPPQD